MPYSRWVTTGSPDLGDAYVSAVVSAANHDTIHMPLSKVMDAVEKGMLILPGDRPVTDLRDEQAAIMGLYNAGFEQAEALNTIMLRNILKELKIEAEPDEVEVVTKQTKGNAKTYLFAEIRHAGKTYTVPDGFVWRNPKTEGKRCAADRKKRLPGFTFAGCFAPQRKAQDLVRATGLYPLDLDGIDDLNAVSAKIRADPSVFAVMRSVTGSGLCAIVRGPVALTATRYTTAYKLIADFFAKDWGIAIDVMDPATSDICRLRFASSDESLYVNWDAEAMEVNVPQEEETQQEEPQQRPPKSERRTPSAAAPERKHAPISEKLLRELLGYIPADDRPTWLSVTGAVKLWGETTGQEDLAYEIADEWAQGSAKYDVAKQEEAWQTLNRGDGDNVATIGTVFYLAKQHGWRGTAAGNGSNNHAKREATDNGADAEREPLRIETVKSLREDKACVEPPQLVEGLLHVGDKLALGAGSKSFKTFTLLNLGLSVGYGKDFLKWKTKKGRVLYVNLELHRWDMLKRLDAIAAAMDIKNVELDMLNLRGYPCAMVVCDAREAVREAAARGVIYELIILEPAYKLLIDRDENSTRDIAQLVSDMSLIADEGGSALAYAQHFAKGNASGKEVIDRLAGSGAFGRDADSILCLTALKEDYAYSVDTVLRSLPPQEAFAVRWKHPLMRLAPDLDPSDLKRQGGRPMEHSYTKLLKVLPATGLDNKGWIKAASEVGIKRTCYYELKAELVEKNLVEEREDVWVPVR